jgi:3-isopropylmalate/(R)-2-methylmalate dehydratase large subunit
MGKTIAEKVFSQKSKLDCHAGDIVVAEVDAAMTNDASGPLSIQIFQKMGSKQVVYPKRIAFIIDHYVPCPNQKVALLHQSIYDFTKKYGIKIFNAGTGIGHQVFDEKGFVAPGRLIIGGDSHTTTYGYLNCLGIGIGSSDMAMFFQSGKLWFKVPETVRFNITGHPKKGITGKEVALYLLSLVGANGGNYLAFEFYGDGLRYLTMDDRRVICNMMAECCVKCSIMPFDEVAKSYCEMHSIPVESAVEPDRDCVYKKTYNVDLSAVDYLIGCPHSPCITKKISELTGTKIDMVLIGTCTNGRLEDFRNFYNFVSEHRGNFVTECLVVPASREIELELAKEGILTGLIERGAMVLPPSCGPCCGSSPGVPLDNFNVLSTANRNFLGRMGNSNAKIYLTSPVVAAAAALTGRIIDPREMGE